jgi:hypothetical protein
MHCPYGPGQHTIPFALIRRGEAARKKDEEHYETTQLFEGNVGYYRHDRFYARTSHEPDPCAQAECRHPIH